MHIIYWSNDSVWLWYLFFYITEHTDSAAFLSRSYSLRRNSGLKLPGVLQAKRSLRGKWSKHSSIAQVINWCKIWEEKKGNLVYYSLLNSILKTRFRQQVSETFHPRCPCYYLSPERVVWTALRYTAGFSLLRQPQILQHLLLKLQTWFPSQDPWSNFLVIVVEILV